jgi:hypothetical protein
LVNLIGEGLKTECLAFKRVEGPDVKHLSKRLVERHIPDVQAHVPSRGL